MRPSHSHFYQYSHENRRSTSFSHHRYSSFRPTYPQSLYTAILTYHTGPRNVALDLGTGHALVAREMSTSFAHVHASDPSRGMLEQARELTPTSTHPNVTFHESTAEQSPFLGDGSVDLVTAAQAAHWFDYGALWPELARVVRRGGTVAFWGYKDPVIVGYPRATALLDHCAHDPDPRYLGPYWQQPGRSIVQDKLRAVQPPEGDWEHVRRVEYEPTTGEGTRFMSAKMKMGELAEFIRTWSAFHGWQGQWPGRTRRGEGGEGEGDVVDELMERIREEEPELGEVVELEFGTGLVLARRCSLRQ